MKRAQSFVCRFEIDDMLFEIPIQNGTHDWAWVSLGVKL